jgi:hypothetical protein
MADNSVAPEPIRADLLDYEIRRLDAIALLMKLAAADELHPDRHPMMFELLSDALDTEIGCIRDQMGKRNDAL